MLLDNILFPFLSIINWILSQWWFWVLFPFLLLYFLANPTQSHKKILTSDIKEERLTSTHPADRSEEDDEF